MTGTGRDCLLHAAAHLLLSVLLLGTLPAADAASALSASSTIAAVSTCQSRTVNYITHILPQQCLKTGWAGASILEESGINSEVAETGTIDDPPSASEPEQQSLSLGLHPTSQGKAAVVETALTSINAPATTVEPSSAAASQAISATNAAEDIDRETEALLNEANFLSFEEWKKQNLQRAGQSDENIGDRRQVRKERRRRPGGIDSVLDSLGEDSEIELDFGGFVSGGSGTIAPSPWSTATRSGAGPVSKTNAPESEDGVRGTRSRPKDAGKTCSERFNYASFDCAATVLKTNPECKGSSSILVENKDSYMLNECAANSKFFIVELCNDILVDTVVLANFEFFSSMFRSFRVSVSDRYPTAAERWKELGVFEARNSREVQAFPVQNPLIWARYLRVEFLTHYGNEFYCPVSLLRVHGTTMMEEFRREEDASRVEEESALEAVPETETTAQDFVAAENATPETQSFASGVAKKPSDEKASGQSSSASNETGEIGDNPGGIVTKSTDEDKSTCDQQLIAEFEAFFLPFNISGPFECKPSDATENGQVGISHTQDVRPEPSREDIPTASPSPANQAAPPSPAKDPAPASVQPTQLSKNSNITKDATTPTAADASAKMSNHTSQDVRHHQASTTSPPPANPTTQESFFKTIHKRLQLLEANATLSLQYIEQQSRILRDAFVKVEKRQLTRTTNFLENLNATVLNELRGFRQTYDLLWQSTVIELENQREQSQREIVAITARLSILADEVIFQKRMFIVQSLLLLLCLGLVLFSRYPATASYLELPLLQSMLARSQTTLSSPYESPPGSPRSASSTRPSSARRNSRKSHFGHSRQPSDESTSSLQSPTPEFSPPTPSSGTTYGGDGDRTDCRRRRADSSPPGVSSECSKGLRETSQASPSIPVWTRDLSGRRDPITWSSPGRGKENEGLLSPDRAPERKGEGTGRIFSPLKQQQMQEDEEGSGDEEERK